MLKKIGLVAGAIAGGYIGYGWAMEYIEIDGVNMNDYWSKQGADFLRILLTLIFGGIGAAAGYFIMDFFRRFE